MSRRSRVRKSEVSSPKSEVEKDSAPDSYRDGTSHSAIKETLTTDNSQHTTKEMEVNHHPQIENKPKPWKEYQLEGLMIFLADTMGFYAESMREHISNKGIRVTSLSCHYWPI